MKFPLPPNSLRVFLSKLKLFWREWDIQSMVLTSFVIQLILIFLSPFRKQTSNWIVILTVWVAYLLADWVAIQAIGLISNPCRSTSSSDDLYAFWAQFLLLHLGGPDTITALALEDSELWLRTGLHLGVQVYGSFSVLVKTVARSQSSLWAPTLLIFITGIIKYTERVSSLFHGRLLKFSNQDPDSWTKLRRLVPDGFDVDYSDLSNQITAGDNKEMTGVEISRCAGFFFHYYKPMYAGLEPSSTLQDDITYYICKSTSSDVLKVVEIQLNLAYEVLFTKTVIICSTFWKVLRFTVTLLQLACLVIWLFFTNKDGFGPDYRNIRITHTLLVGAVAVDFLSFVRIQLWSDWTISHLEKGSIIMNWLYNGVILAARERTWGRYRRKEDAPKWECLRRTFCRRWSETIPQLSLIGLWMEPPPPSEFMNKVTGFFGVNEALERRRHVSRKWFSDHLMVFMFEDLKQKVQTKGGVENICKVKGGWACMRLYQTHMVALPHVRMVLNISTDYDLVLMRWHIITELCYTDDDDDQIGHSNSEEEQNYREICKTLSDYMMFLLIYQQDMMPLLPYVSQERLRKLQRDLKYLAVGDREMASEKRKKVRHQMACKSIRLHCTTDACSTEVNLFPIDQIMEELRGLEEKEIGKWEFMAKVWGELLYYAAFHCKPSLHAAKLKQGGELISFVWLLLHLLGFGVYESESSRSKLNNVELNESARDLLYVYNEEGWKTSYMIRRLISNHSPN